MSNSISGIGGLQSLSSVLSPHGPTATAAPKGIAGLPRDAKVDHTDLENSFTKALGEARALDHDAASQAEKFANNDPSVGIHEVMIASEKANIALRYATTIKNKALEAYKELMGTQV